jgi:hypothetical protein
MTTDGPRGPAGVHGEERLPMRIDDWSDHLEPHGHSNCRPRRRVLVDAFDPGDGRGLDGTSRSHPRDCIPEIASPRLHPRDRIPEIASPRLHPRDFLPEIASPRFRRLHGRSPHDDGAECVSPMASLIRWAWPTLRIPSCSSVPSSAPSALLIRNACLASLGSACRAGSPRLRLISSEPRELRLM